MKIFTIALITLFLSVSVSYSQKKPQKKTATTAKTITDVYNNSAFDPSVSQLPTNFNGANPRQVFSSIKFLPKWEFENSKQYAERIERFENQLLFGDVTPKTTIAFSFSEDPLSIFSQVETSYNADEKKFFINLQAAVFSILAPRLKEGIESTVAVELKSSLVNARSYIGSNAYGVKKRVSSYTQETYLLAFENCTKKSQGTYREEKSSIITDRINLILKLLML